MQSIGERFEEARKRKGISLREASEATKIRSDFLCNIEQNKFSFDLPEIYKRGFLKNYARYLKLDPENLLTEYKAHILSQSRSGKKGTELFGSMEVTGGAPDEPIDPQAEPSYGHISSSKTAAEPDATPEVDDSDKIFYIKAGLVFVGIIALLVVLLGLAKAIMGSGAPQIDDSQLDDPATIAEPAEPVAALVQPAAADETITLIASGNVYVLVKQLNNNQELLRRTLADGETVSLAKSGPIDILFTAGEHLVIVDSAGEKLRPKGTGTAKISIP